MNLALVQLLMAIQAQRHVIARVRYDWIPI
jgi:hypothetical protein